MVYSIQVWGLYRCFMALGLLHKIVIFRWFAEPIYRYFWIYFQAYDINMIFGFVWTWVPSGNVLQFAMEAVA